VYKSTGDAAFLRAAQDTAHILVSTQLLSGGWYYWIETDPQLRATWCYRSLMQTPKQCEEIKGNKIKNNTLLDDNNTQSALGFLLWMDEVLDGSDAQIREALQYGLGKLVDAQYPNGAWPNILRGSRPKELNKTIDPKLTASIPAEPWPRTWVKPHEPVYFILNDNAMRDVVRLLLAAESRFKDPKYLDAAKRTGDFLIAAQLPAPQRGWAQQYDVRMNPVWGRVFEPPALASRETAGCLDTLLQIYARTEDRRYLDHAQEAAAWLKTTRLSDGTWSRFYELGTNKPLYVDENNGVSYSDAGLLSHYALKGTFDIPEVLGREESMAAGGADKLRPIWPDETDDWSDSELETQVRKLIEQQDDQGRWLRDGWIKSADFVEAMFALARYRDKVAAPKQQ
jgi:hypothetical protein